MALTVSSSFGTNMALQTSTYTSPEGATAANIYWMLYTGNFSRAEKPTRWNSQTLPQGPKFGFPCQLRGFKDKATADAQPAEPMFIIDFTMPDITTLVIPAGGNLITGLYNWVVANLTGFANAINV